MGWVQPVRRGEIPARQATIVYREPGCSLSLSLFPFFFLSIILVNNWNIFARSDENPWKASKVQENTLSSGVVRQVAPPNLLRLARWELAQCNLRKAAARNVATGSEAKSVHETNGCGCQSRFGIPFWLVGEFTTHFRTYFSGDYIGCSLGVGGT